MEKGYLDLTLSLKGHHKWFQGSINGVGPTVYSLVRNCYIFALKQTPNQTESLTSRVLLCCPVWPLSHRLRAFVLMEKYVT